jgi:hypothetical protein
MQFGDGSYIWSYNALYSVEREVFAFLKRWRKQTKRFFLHDRNWKARDKLRDGNSKQWKLYNWLNIINIFKKITDFSFEKRKNFPFNPIEMLLMINAFLSCRILLRTGLLQLFTDVFLMRFNALFITRVAVKLASTRSWVQGYTSSRRMLGGWSRMRAGFLTSLPFLLQCRCSRYSLRRPPETSEVHSKFWSWNLKGRYSFIDLDVNGRTIKKIGLNK